MNLIFLYKLNLVFYNNIIVDLSVFKTTFSVGRLLYIDLIFHIRKYESSNVLFCCAQNMLRVDIIEIVVGLIVNIIPMIFLVVLMLASGTFLGIYGNYSYSNLRGMLKKLDYVVMYACSSLSICPSMVFRRSKVFGSPSISF